MTRSSQVITSICLVSFCSTVAAADVPTKIAGQVIDFLDKPVPGVQVRLIRGSGFSLDPATVGNIEELGSSETDTMGHFLIRPDQSGRSRGSVILIAEHRDYLPKNVEIDKTSMTLVVKLTPRKAVERVWRVRDEEDSQVAVARAVELLRGDGHSNWPDRWIADIYPHIGSIRDILQRVATSGKWESPVKKGAQSPAHRARMLLAYWGDERDGKHVERWWNERQIRHGKRLLFDKLLPPAKPADSLEEAVANWRTLTDIESGFTATLSQVSGRALVALYVILPDLSYEYHIVFLKQEGKWRPAFHRRRKGVRTH